MSKRPFVAIVDDDDSSRETMKDLVESAGFSAATFVRAPDLLKSRQLSSFLCVITDVRMPGMTGLELHHQLVASNRAIPTILVTAYPDEVKQAQAVRAKVVCYLEKPFTAEELLSCLRQALNHWDAGLGK